MPVWDPGKRAVKQDLVEFRKDPAKVKKYINDALEHGYFIALEEARAVGFIGMALFQHEYRRYHDALLPEIHEAKKVIPHVQMALHRLERACLEGSQRRHIDRLFAQPDNVNVQDSIRALQGWLATFFGNYLKFVGFVRGSRITEEVIRQWASDSWKILQKRKSEESMSCSEAS